MHDTSVLHEACTIVPYVQHYISTSCFAVQYNIILYILTYINARPLHGTKVGLSVSAVIQHWQRLYSSSLAASPHLRKVGSSRMCTHLPIIAQGAFIDRNVVGRCRRRIAWLACNQNQFHRRTRMNRPKLILRMDKVERGIFGHCSALATSFLLEWKTLQVQVAEGQEDWAPASIGASWIIVQRSIAFTLNGHYKKQNLGLK